MDWIKFYTRKWLWGSGRDMSAEERGIWADLMAMAGETKLRDGSLRFDVGKPMPREYIATVLRVPLERFNACLDIYAKDINTEDGSPRIKIWDDGTIELVKFIELQGLSSKEKTEQPKEKSQEERDLGEKAYLFRLAKKHPDIARKALLEHDKSEQGERERQHQLTALTERSMKETKHRGEAK